MQKYTQLQNKMDKYNVCIVLDAMDCKYLFDYERCLYVASFADVFGLVTSSLSMNVC